MDIQFPEEQFKNAMPDGYIPGWRRRFMICVAKGLIMHDRVSTAIAEPTRRNIVRATLGGFRTGEVMVLLLTLSYLYLLVLPLLL